MFALVISYGLIILIIIIITSNKEVPVAHYDSQYIRYIHMFHCLWFAVDIVCVSQYTKLTYLIVYDLEYLKHT